MGRTTACGGIIVEADADCGVEETTVVAVKAC